MTRSLLIALFLSIQAKALEPVRISTDGTHFVLQHSGERFTPWGFNYLGEFGAVFEEYWAEKWPDIEHDFRELITGTLKTGVSCS